MELDLLKAVFYQVTNIRRLSDGNLYGESTGNDPYFVIECGTFTQCYIYVSMKLDNIQSPDKTYLYCKLYFLEHGMSIFDEEHSLSEPIKSIGEFQIYRFKCLPFQLKKITGIRFDPINCKSDIIINEFSLRSYREEDGYFDQNDRYGLDFLILSYYSRSGSTLLMKILTAHPGITGYTKGTHDAHILKYFTRFYYMIKTSHIYTADQSQGSMIRRLELLADHYSPESVLPKPFEFPQQMNINTFRKYYTEFLSSYLPRLVHNMDMPHQDCAVYYLEKHMDGNSFGLLKAMFELLPRSKMIMLFRDPRDVYSSYLSFSEKENIIKMNGNTEITIKRIMEHYIRRQELLQEFKYVTHMVRYEDLVLAPTEAVCNILKFLGLEHNTNSISDMIKPIKINDLQAKRHITSSSAKESIGRWKGELSDSEKSCFIQYNNIIERLGYDVT